MRLLSIFLLAPLAGACGCSASASNPTTSGDASIDATPVVTHEPSHHRPVALGCPTTRDPGKAGSPRSGDKCAADTDCTTGKNGRCMESLAGNVCSYDDCAGDADCGSGGVCDCRDPDLYGANTCFKGNCHVDKDCGKGSGFCSPSGLISTSCPGLPLGAIGFFCHTPGDECADDGDCGDKPGGSCAYSPDALHWKCFYLACRG